MSDIQLVLTASILVSLSVMCGFLYSWFASGRLYGKRFNYLIYYALYMAISNIPKLSMTIAGVSTHSAIWVILDSAGLLLLLLAADAWGGKGVRHWHWFIVIAGTMSSIAHNITGQKVFATGYSIAVLAVLLIMLYNIWAKSQPVIAFFVAVSFRNHPKTGK